MKSGRMRGQAFVSMADVDTATACIEALQGYVLNGKPMLISYSQQQQHQ